MVDREREKFSKRKFCESGREIIHWMVETVAEYHTFESFREVIHRMIKAFTKCEKP
jgi:hypothetical protein